MKFEWTRVIGFQWDGGNARKSLDRHGVSQAEAEQVFLGPRCLVASDSRHLGEEPRFHALGTTDAGRLLHVTFTLRAAGTLVRIISARDMHRKERWIYERATQTPPAVHDRGRGARLVGKP